MCQSNYSGDCLFYYPLRCVAALQQIWFDIIKKSGEGRKEIYVGLSL